MAGRPSKYKPEFCEQAAKLCRLGATDIEIADFFGVAKATINTWKLQRPEFLDSLKAAKAEADARVEQSLYHKAVGYSFDSEKIFNNQGEVIRAKTREHVPPDTTAMIFWLKNRRPEQWRDKHEVEHIHTAKRMSDNELERIAAGGGKGAPGAEDGSKVVH